jgi:hypothetical protein
MDSPLIIVAIVAAIASIGGSALVFWSSRGKTRVDAKTALDARIDALVTDQLKEAWDQIDRQAKQLKQVDFINRVTFRHVEDLRDHINAHKPPPAPPMPAVLEEWHNGTTTPGVE